MRRRLVLVSAAICVLAAEGLAAKEGIQDTTSRRTNEAPVGTQDRPPVPAEPQPGDVRDYTTPSPTKPGTPEDPAGTPTPPPPSIPQSPGQSPASPPATGGQTGATTGSQPGGTGGAMTQGARGQLPAGYQDLSQYFRGNDRSPRQIVGRPVMNLDNQRVGMVREVVSRDGRRFAVIELDRDNNNRERQVVVAFERLFADQNGQTIMINTRGRADLDRMPRFDARNFQPVR